RFLRLRLAGPFADQPYADAVVPLVRVEGLRAIAVAEPRGPHRQALAAAPGAAVGHPLADVAVEIIKPRSAGGKTCHRRGGGEAVVAVAAVAAAEACAVGGVPAVGGRAGWLAGAARGAPFGRGRRPVARAGLRREPGNVGLQHGITDADHRMGVAGIDVGLAPVTVAGAEQEAALAIAAGGGIGGEVVVARLLP